MEWAECSCRGSNLEAYHLHTPVQDKPDFPGGAAEGSELKDEEDEEDEEKEEEEEEEEEEAGSDLAVFDADGAQPAGGVGGTKEDSLGSIGTMKNKTELEVAAGESNTSPVSGGNATTSQAVGGSELTGAFSPKLCLLQNYSNGYFFIF